MAFQTEKKKENRSQTCLLPGPLSPSLFLLLSRYPLPLCGYEETAKRKSRDSLKPQHCLLLRGGGSLSGEPVLSHRSLRPNL